MSPPAMMRLGLALVAITSMTVPRALAREGTPNFLIIVTDDQGYANLSAFKHHAEDVHTPNMDRLAARGVLFTDAYTSAPVCSPSRAGWNTGQHPVRWDPKSSFGCGLPEDVKHVAEIMKANGYVTARIGNNDYGKPKRYAWNDWYRTPDMERLAAQGVRFSNFYSHTVCSPTRVSIMSGQNSARHRCTDYIFPWKNNRLIDNEKYPLAVCQHVPIGWNRAGLTKNDATLPRLLKQVGYKTIHVGKGHFAPDKHTGTDPRNIGFDVNVASSCIGAPGSYYGRNGFGKGSKNVHARAVPGLDKYHGMDTFLTEALTLEMNAYRFRPNEPITMGEFSQMAVNGLQIPLSITASHFEDVGRGHPAFKYIETLYDYSTQSRQPVFDFEPRKDFRTALAHPDRKVSGAQAAKILSGLLKKKVPAPSNSDADLMRGEAAQLVYQYL